MVAVVLATVVLVACTDDGEQDRSDPVEEVGERAVTAPAEATTVLDAATPEDLALAVSAALFVSAPLAVLAPTADPAAQQEAAGQAQDLGVPLLLGTGAGVQGELERLGVEEVVVTGEMDVAGLEGVEVTEEPEEPRGDPLDGVVVLTTGDPAQTAAAATARAAGADARTLPSADPRSDPETIAALAAERPEHVVALGAGFGTPDQLSYRLDVAATGVELAGGGQVVYPYRRHVALYGTPGSGALGILGEQPVGEAVARAQALAAEYQPLSDVPVVPTFEIITTVASEFPGDDGNYSTELATEDIRPWVDAAREAGVHVVLDLQPGRTDFLTQARRYEDLLREPHVGLALDPEWRLEPDQRHLAQIGSVGAEEVNAVIAWLADVTREALLPQKVLVLHQFQLRMITDRTLVDTTRDEVAVVVHADGNGAPSDKLATWESLRSEPLPGAWWAWKNFIDEDAPTLTPAETLAVQPPPVLISYQ